MFETVAPSRALRSSRNALYEALSFSLVVHAAAVGGALASNLWKVTFPAVAPVYTVAFVLAAPPPPPPPPPPRPLAEKPEPVTRSAMKLPPNIVVAPTVIPDEIPVVQSDIELVSLAAPEGTTSGSVDGLAGGAAGGVEGGEAGGQAGGVAGGVVFEDGRVHIERDAKLPMESVSQIYPEYPEYARSRAWEDELIVRYVIGKDGRVKEVSVVSPPEHDVFVDPTVKAIRSWRFRPMIHDGERQEVVHELTVYFRLTQRS